MRTQRPLRTLLAIAGALVVIASCADAREPEISAAARGGQECTGLRLLVLDGLEFPRASTAADPPSTLEEITAEAAALRAAVALVPVEHHVVLITQIDLAEAYAKMTKAERSELSPALQQRMTDAKDASNVALDALVPWTVARCPVEKPIWACHQRRGSSYGRSIDPRRGADDPADTVPGGWNVDLGRDDKKAEFATIGDDGLATSYSRVDGSPNGWFLGEQVSCDLG